MNFLSAESLAAEGVSSAENLSRALAPTPLTPPPHAPVVVIGGGLTGLSVAANFVAAGGMCITARSDSNRLHYA